MCQCVQSRDDGPAYVEFDIQRSDTTFIGVVLQTQNIFTQEAKIYDLTGKTAYWIIVLPSGNQVASTLSDGGLDFDQSTGALIYPMTAAESAALPASAMRTVLRVIDNASGNVTTWLDGYIVPRG